MTNDLFFVLRCTRAGKRFVRLGEIPEIVRNEIRKLDSAPKIRNASGNAVPIVETVNIKVQIGKSVDLVPFFVTYRLANSVILRFNFCNQHPKPFKIRLVIFEMEDGSTMPIFRKSFKPNTNLPMPKEQEFPQWKNCYFLRLKSDTKTRI